MKRVAEWFEQLLKQHSISIANPSSLHQDVADLKFLGDAFQGKSQLPINTDLSDYFRRTLGLEFIIKAIHRALQTESSKTITSSLWLFQGSDISLTTRTQQSRNRDKLWELIVACTTSLFCHDVRLDEPDVRCFYNNNDWGLACKILYTADRDSQIDRIIVGAKQIEKSTAQLGCIMVNVTNLIDHSKYLRARSDDPNVFFSFNDWKTPLKLLQADIINIAKPLRTRNLMDRLTRDLRNGRERWKSRGIIYMAQTVCSFGSTLMLLTVCVFHDFRIIRGAEILFKDHFNRAAQSTMNEVIG